VGIIRNSGLLFRDCISEAALHESPVSAMTWSSEKNTTYGHIRTIFPHSLPDIGNKCIVYIHIFSKLCTKRLQRESR